MRRAQKGFTLIELLVVIAIIGILAAIAIPQFSAYRQRGFDARAKSDLRNAANAEEAYFATNEAYISCSSASDCASKLPGFQPSKDSVVTMTDATDHFTGTGTHPNGSGATYTWDSSKGGLQ